MTRPHARRTAAVTLGTAAAAFFLSSPAASAAGLPAPTVSATELTPGGTVTVSGTGCIDPLHGQQFVEPAGVLIAGDSGLQISAATQAADDGTWSITTSVGAASTPGTHQIKATCDQYTEDVDYPAITVTIPTATASPAPAPKPLTTGNRATLDKITNNVPFALGERFTASYPGFKPFEVVTLVLHSTPQNVGTFTADASGVVTVSFSIPAGTAAGSHSLTMSGNLGTSFAQALTVSSSRSLAYTGTDVAPQLAVGVALLLVGGGLTVVARRRKAGAQQV